MVIWSTRGTQRKGGQQIVMLSTTTAVAVKTTMETITPLGIMLSYMAINRQLIRVGFLPQLTHRDLTASKIGLSMQHQPISTFANHSKTQHCYSILQTDHHPLHLE